MHTKWSAAYNSVFWQPTRGIYADWIDINDVVHSYFYTDQNMLAIITGLANSTQAAAILSALDVSYAQLMSEFDVTRDQLYATPANMWPVDVRLHSCGLAHTTSLRVSHSCLLRSHMYKNTKHT